MKKKIYLLSIITVLTLLPGSLSGCGRTLTVSKTPNAITSVESSPIPMLDKTRESSGTGGTTSWLMEKTPKHKGLRWKHPNNFANTRGIYVSFPDNQTLENEINSWIETQKNDLRDIYTRHNSWDTFKNSLWEEVNYYGSVLNITLTLEGEYYRCALFDIQAGKRLTLSDLFYDKYNYIEYINSEIQRQIFDTDFVAIAARRMGYTYSRGFSIEDVIKRPFTGLENDFLNFSLHSGDLEIYFDGENPFFYCQMSFDIPLLPADSPWGKSPAQTYNIPYYTEQPLGKYGKIVVPVIEPTKKRFKKAVGKINNTINEMLKAIRSNPDTLAYYNKKRNATLLYTHVYINHKRYMSVYFDTDDMAPTPLNAVTLDTKTGKTVLFPNMVSLTRLSSKNVAVSKHDTGSYSDDYRKHYTPPNGSKCTAVWLSYDNRIYAKIKEPSGAVASMVVTNSKEVLKKAGITKK